jgi:hypothetical protein
MHKRVSPHTSDVEASKTGDFVRVARLSMLIEPSTAVFVV